MMFTVRRCWTSARMCTVQPQKDIKVVDEGRSWIYLNSMLISIN